ncbi:hypothetical protein GCM10022403_065450 [Streptomyces coacervatus]|uniref:Secreted protein n=1 Tax=Streptomyces coacervatus TaxID=647381 RepID=A0ABP7INZ6_9ACTN|nr:hypothetical protein [Streptomyces coacervatus]MDF2268656.1 hypothetical protein [Streptomyces coacervatus]
MSRALVRSLAAGAALLTSVFVTPAATAATPTADELRLPGTAVQFTPTASAQTKALAAQHKAVVRAAATECGSGYKLNFAERLPDSRRYGTLFTYTKTNSQGFSGACAIFDNNMPGGMKMKLKLCTNRVNPTCKVDEGLFTQYAGPVKIEGSHSDVFCSKVTAIMWDGIAGPAIIDAVRSATPCD